MSGAALGWAWKQPVPMASAKFVLVLLADQTAGDLAFMAVSTIAQRTGLDRKTVMAAIARLVEWGLVEDTGERRGRTGSVPVYRLRMNEGLFDHAPYPGSTKSGTGTQTGTASEAVPVLGASGTVFPAKRYQKRDTDPQLIQDDPTRTPRARDGKAPGAEAAPVPSPGALATRAMIEAGMPAARVNPSHPELLRALDAGISPAELADVTRELISRGTGPPHMTYVTRTALGRRRDAPWEPTDASQPTPTDRDRRGRRRARSAVGRQLEAIKRRRARETAGIDPAGPFAAGENG